MIFDPAAPTGPVMWQPLYETDGQQVRNDVFTGLAADMIFDPPAPGWVPSRPAIPNPVPAYPSGLSNVQYIDQLNMPPSDIYTSYYQLQPLIIGEKHGQRTVEWT